MTEAQVRSLFTVAGFAVTSLWPTFNGYHGGLAHTQRYLPDHISEYIEGATPLTRQHLDFIQSARPHFEDPWWIVVTAYGVIQIGWRKRVISINWEATPHRAHVTEDNVTQSDTDVHAWTLLKAAEYLTRLKVLLEGRK